MLDSVALQVLFIHIYLFTIYYLIDAMYLIIGFVFVLLVYLSLFHPDQWSAQHLKYLGQISIWRVVIYYSQSLPLNGALNSLSPLKVKESIPVKWGKSST